MSLTFDDLFASPDHYLHSFDGDAAVFVPMDRAAYHRSIFLDGRISPLSNGTMRMPLDQLAPRLRPALPISWLFHMAHCGSTLLARALDHPDASLVLREPLALRQTAIHAPGLLPLVAPMLGKRYRADAPTLVKVNVPVNFLLPQIAASDPAARAILLYLPLRDYLLAILRSDNHREWLRTVTGQIAVYLGDISALSDAELTAALWWAQANAFRRALDAMPNACALDAQLFFAEPEGVLRAAARHLALPISDATLAETVAGTLFATYSKNPSLKFDNRARLDRLAGLEQTLAPEIDVAMAWISRQEGETPEAALAAAALIR